MKFRESLHIFSMEILCIFNCLIKFYVYVAETFGFMRNLTKLPVTQFIL
jgi:hypothetical protein